MYGSSGKLGGRGRGGGGGGGGKRNRSSFPPPPPNRPIVPPISTTTSNRLSTGGGASSSSARNRHESANASSSPNESYSLVSDDPLSYAMIIRLAPDLVEEIRRVEAQGETARIKFDSNANNSVGNVIDVGGKDFRFTWSQEVGDLCDIYEERRSSDDRKGVLIESGCPWRKLAVQRILDESAKNHIKMLSEEAEQKSKARKTMVLDHGNPSVKNQLKSLAAVDSNPRKMGMKSKKEPAPKKRKVEPSQVSYSVKVNGDLFGNIKPSRGIRQGDPLSPYIFILCAEILSTNISKLESQGLFQGLCMSRSTPPISHLMYADDLLITANGKPDQAYNLLEVLNQYSSSAGQKFNRTKSMIIHSPRAGSNSVRQLTNIFPFQATSTPPIYLGTPIHSGHNSREMYMPLLDKFQNKLKEWKMKTLNPAGRLILINTALAPSANHIMQTTLLPVHVHDKIDKMKRDFFWGHDNSVRKLHTLSWGKFTTKKKEGGLGIRSSLEMNKALLFKTLWNIQANPESLWAKLCQHKYLKHQPMTSIGRSTCSSPSHLWSNLKVIAPYLLGECFSKINDGRSTSIWETNWIPDHQPLVAPQQPIQEMLVADLIDSRSNTWRWDRIQQYLPSSAARKVRDIQLPTIPIQDSIQWQQSKTGKYTVSSGYTVLTTNTATTPTNLIPNTGFVWKLPCPPKIRMFIWKALNNGITTLALLHRRHIATSEECPRCRNHPETTEHMLLHCNATHQIWDVFMSQVVISGRCPNVPNYNPPTSLMQLLQRTRTINQSPPKSVFKAGLSSSATPPVGRLSFPSPEQPFTSTSPFGSGSLSKASAAIEVPRASSKENIVTEKVTPSRNVHAVGRESSRIKKGSEATPKDLQSMLITVLLENPKGMTIKSLEKELGDSVPNCCKKIEPILKKIAIYKAPGRYSLKTGVDLDLESFKKLSSGSGSSPDFAHDQTPLQDSNAVEKATTKEFEHQKQLDSKQEESNIVEIVENQQNSPNTFGDKKTSDHSDGHPSSSESDSDSSDSGSSRSQSKSQSKSRSPAGRGSTSDSESDGSSSSKEGSDVDVDIMTGDDDREESGSKLQAHITTAPMPWRTPDDGTVQNRISRDKQDARMSDAVDIGGDLPNDDIEMDILGDDDTAPFETNMRSLEENVMPGLSQPGNGQQKSFLRNTDNESQNMTSYSDLNSSSRSVKAKSRKGSELNYFHEKSESAKRMKSGGLNPPQTSGRSKDSFASEDPPHLSLDMPDDDNYNVHLANKVGRDGISDTISRKGYNLAMPGISVSDAQRLGQRSGDLNARGKAFDMANRYTENLARGVEHSERSPTYPHDTSMSRDKHSGDAYGNEKSVGKNVRECDLGDKQSIPSESQFRRYGEEVTKVKDAKHMPDSYMGSLPKDTTKTDPEKSPIVNGKGKVLRREVSELELGELPAEETQEVKKQFGRNNSFRNPKNKPVVPDNLDLNGRTAAKTIQESRKLSPPNSRVGIGSTQESSRKRTPEDDNEDSWMRPQQRVGQYQGPQMPRADLTDSEAGSQLNRLSDMGSKPRKNGYGDTNKKGSVSIPQQSETKSSGQAAVHITMPESNDRKDSFGMGSHNSNRKRRESSSDEINCPHSKFEKDEPELRGPIKDISQYKDYVQEYSEKYESYCSLNENLETYRNDFNKLGRDLALTKSKDMKRYYDILEQLKESYRQCGTRHKRLKKIFILLHEELKHLKQRIDDYALPYTRE